MSKLARINLVLPEWEERDSVFKQGKTDPFKVTERRTPTGYITTFQIISIELLDSFQHVRVIGHLR